MIQSVIPAFQINIILQVFLLKRFSTRVSTDTFSPFGLHLNYMQIKKQNNLAPSGNSSTASLSCGFVG